MLAENREYNFIGELTIQKSSIIDKVSQPKDDKINWLFLEFKNRQFSFIYKILDPASALYNKPFKVYLSFTMKEKVQEMITLNSTYEILRGQEHIGQVKITGIF